jgi:hypothetical protein
MQSGISRWLLVLLLLPLLLATPRSYTQGITTGTIIGVIVDPQGAVIPNAAVTATNTATGVVLRTTSLSAGDFAFRAVPVGTYKVQVDAKGFNAATISSVAVNSGVTSDLKTIGMQVGSTEVVQVSGSDLELLSPTESQVTTTFSTENVETLPLNNGFDTITETIPGVASTHMDNFSNTNGDNFSVNGQSGRGNNFELDGQNNNDNSIGGPQLFFGNQDAISQMQVVTDDYGAQYGRNAGAVVNYITKSGTNHFHGSAFEMYQGQALSSMTNGDKQPLFGYCTPGQSVSSGCSAPVLPRYVENRYGATLGGPVLKNRLFLFGSTYWDRVYPGVTPSFSAPFLTPTPSGIATLESAFPNSPAVAMLKTVGPYAVATGNPAPVGTTTETVTGPGGTSVPVQFGGVTRTISTPFTDEENMGRLDWQPDANDHIFVRYFQQTETSFGVAGNSIAAGDWVNVPDDNYSVGTDWTHTFSPHWLDQLRYSFQEEKVFFEGGSFANCVSTGLTNCPTSVNFTGTNFDLGFGIGPGFPQGRTVKETQIQDNATWTRGNHTVIFGGEFDYQNSPNVFLPFYNGQYEYGDFSNFMADSGSLNLANGNPVIPFTEPDTALYAQDDWRIRPSLTAHLGFRWEYFSQAVNELHKETVARESNPNTAFWDTSLPLSDRTVPYVSEFYGNLEPRIGLAWNPAFDQKLVVNAGYAINTNPAFYNIFLIAAIATPVANTGSVTCSGNCQPASGSPYSAAVRAQNLPSLPTGVNPGFRAENYDPTNFRTPMVQTWYLGVQHQIGPAMVGTVRYVGTHTSDNFQSVNANPYLANIAAAFPSYGLPSLCTDSTAPGYGRPNCNASNLMMVTNGGWADYDGLDLNLTTHNYHGFTGTVSYTWSREVDNVTDVFSTGSGGSTNQFAQNPMNTDQGETGVDGNSYPNVVGAQMTWQMPKLIQSNGLMSRLVNGFTLTSLYRFTSGQPFNPFQPLILDGNTGDTSFCDFSFDSSTLPNEPEDTCRLVLSNPKAPLNSVAYLNAYTGPLVSGAPTKGTPAWVQYNSDGFTTSGAYNPGTPTSPTDNHWIVDNQAYASSVGNPYPGSGRNILRGPNFSDLDVNLFKEFAITEQVKLQLNFSGYNVLNQMYRGVGNPDVGVYTPPGAGFNDFLSTAENVVGTVPGNTSGQRFFMYGGKIVF